jgi:hypothetical protein
MFPCCEIPSFTPIQENKQNYNFVYFNHYILVNTFGIKNRIRLNQYEQIFLVHVYLDTKQEETSVAHVTTCEYSYKKNIALSITVCLPNRESVI